ncbi:pilus assembly protein CpaE [Nakamurella antarctica]|uniref:Pilus assembly protein CpaE n=1 Tax=Nakamurella antarctica TaxID=1902245 RepID=A0A3G8ZKV6_9ACTN|nr:pilus assembly protein CpaE [Nakamurella antarctica]AZI57942.1 pilus assembly protein CpaE [Nakamurella antarctica]
MITIEVARSLNEGGVKWEPAIGDWFVVADRDMDSDFFVLSNMTAEIHQFPSATVIGFNGTTEWALDSVEAEQALWLPREAQLREMLGGALQSLEKTDQGWVVNLLVNEKPWHVSDPDAEQAYALALLFLVAG